MNPVRALVALGRKGGRGTKLGPEPAAWLIWTAGCNKQPDTYTHRRRNAERRRQSGSPKAQELIDSANKLVGEGQFQEALAKLTPIGGEKLSLNQKTMVDALRAQFEKPWVRLQISERRRCADQKVERILRHE